MTEGKLMSMTLHSWIKLENIKILRVVGGWIYMFYDSMHMHIESTQFVSELIYDEELVEEPIKIGYTEPFGGIKK